MPCAASSSGAFQNAMIASPMYLSTVPSSPRMMSVIGDRYSLRKVDSSTAVNPSDSVVNERMSQNITVRSRFSPPSCRRSGFSASRATTAGET